MERDLDEILVSQEKMLARLNKPAASRTTIERSFIEHLRRLREWLAKQPNIEALHVSYNELLQRPEQQSEYIGAFLGGHPDTGKMAATVDSALYRNRKTRMSHCSEEALGGTG